MKVKTKSGVSISFVQEGSSTIILFDTFVRGVELTKEESLRIGALLASDSNDAGSEKPSKTTQKRG
jgi:hypothetical protein